MDLDVIVSILAAILSVGAGTLSAGALAALRSAWQRRFKRDADADELSANVAKQRETDIFVPRSPLNLTWEDGRFAGGGSDDDEDAREEPASADHEGRSLSLEDVRSDFHVSQQRDEDLKNDVRIRIGDDGQVHLESEPSPDINDRHHPSIGVGASKFTPAARRLIISEAEDVARAYEIESARFAHHDGASMVDVQHVAASKGQVAQMQLSQANGGKGRTPEQRAFLVAAGALCSGFAAGTTPSLFAEFSTGWFIAVVVAGIAGITLLVLGNPWWPRQKSAP